jgi:hypothetical protein
MFSTPNSVEIKQEPSYLDSYSSFLDNYHSKFIQMESGPAKYSINFTAAQLGPYESLPLGDGYYVTLPDGVTWTNDHMKESVTLRYKGYSYDISKYMLMEVGKEDIDKLLYQACRSLYLLAAEKNFEASWEKGYKKFKKPTISGKTLPSLSSKPASNNYAYLQTSFKELIFDKGDKSIHKVAVPCPEGCKRGTYGGLIGTKPLERTVYDMIQHLNDEHRWDRATKIADWLDKLHDEGIIDITITSPDPDKA